MAPFLVLGITLTLSLVPGSNGLQSECVPKAYKSADQTLRVGQNIYQDVGNDSIFPCWMDLDLIRVGQNFAKKNIGHIVMGIGFGIIPLLADEQMKRVIATCHRWYYPSHHLKTVLPRAEHAILYMTTDVLSPEWTESIQNVRKVHWKVSSFVQSNPPVYADLSPAKKREFTVGYNFKKNDKMWAAFKMDLMGLDEKPGYRPQSPPFHDPSRKFRFNQYVMSLSLWAFMALPILNPDNLGIKEYNQSDLQGFAHLWAVIGHALGMDDEYLFCTDSLNKFEECRQSLEDTWTHFFIPQLQNLDEEGELGLEIVLNVLADLVPGLSKHFWLINLLEKHMGVPATNLRRQEKLASEVTGSTANWIIHKLPSPNFNAIFRTLMKKHSLSLYGDDGTNATVVARTHFTWSLKD